MAKSLSAKPKKTTEQAIKEIQQAGFDARQMRVELARTYLACEQIAEAMRAIRESVGQVPKSRLFQDADIVQLPVTHKLENNSDEAAASVAATESTDAKKPEGADI